MDGRTLSIGTLAAAVGLIGGFLLANAINRNELITLRAENDRLKNERVQGSSPDAKANLTEEEIAATIRRADQAPADFQTQRNVGIAVYRYATMKQDVNLIKQSMRILERAAALKPDDLDIILSLGNANFDTGYFAKDNDAFAKAREFYKKVLAEKPNDVDVRTDVGLTYFLQTPPDMERAAAEFRKSLEQNPRHEKTLQFIVQALIKLNKSSEAAEYLEQLQAVNPRNESIEELTSMLSSQRPAG
jgi:tetratricopeptide (TPR) repeat protein